MLKNVKFKLLYLNFFRKRRQESDRRFDVGHEGHRRQSDEKLHFIVIFRLLAEKNEAHRRSHRVSDVNQIIFRHTHVERSWITKNFRQIRL